MIQQTVDSTTSLEIRRTFAAPRERVFQAWVEPEALRQWFHPSDQVATPVVEIDLRVGGRYYLEMHGAEGAIHRLGGTYREIIPPEKLVFTWQWLGEDGEAPEAESLVTVVFRPVGDGKTEIVLTHTALSSAEARDNHAQGWEGTLDELGTFLA